MASAQDIFAGKHCDIRASRFSIRIQQYLTVPVRWRGDRSFAYSASSWCSLHKQLVRDGAPFSYTPPVLCNHHPLRTGALELRPPWFVLVWGRTILLLPGS